MTDDKVTVGISEQLEMVRGEILADITNADSEELQKYAADLVTIHEQLAHALAILDDSKVAVQAEIDRRALKAYWQAHPELTPLEIGDKVLVTQEYNDWYRENTNPRFGSSRKIGEVTEISYFELTNGEPTGAGFSFAGTTRLLIAMNMRRAFLQAHPESEATDDQQT